MADFNQTKLWITRDGQTLEITEMSDSHLENAIAMLKRKAQGIRTCEALNAEAAWIMAADTDPDFLVDSIFVSPEDSWGWLKRTPLVKAMRRERKRRREGNVVACPSGSEEYVCAAHGPFWRICDSCELEPPSGGFMRG